MRAAFLLLFAASFVIAPRVAAEGLNVTGADSTPVRGGTLLYGRAIDALGLDPAHESDGESFKVCDNLYETLVRFEEGGTEVEPLLATGWSLSADGLTWTFTLRDGVTFHCGAPCDARAVAYSLERQWGKRTPLHPAHGVGGPYPVWGYLGLDETLAGVDVVDSRTIRFRLREPCSPFLSDLACNFAAIVCPEDAERRGEEFYRHPCGTGPFRLASWIPGASIELLRFEEYSRAAPFLDCVQFLAIPKSTDRFFRLVSGTVDVIDGIPPEDVAALEKDPNVRTIGALGMNVAYLAMNLDHEPYGSELVRRAVNAAIDVKSLVAEIYGAQGEPARGPLPPNVFGFDATLPETRFDPDLARSLLREAGYPEGFETTLWTMANPRPYMPEPLRVAQRLQTMLAEVGIRAKIVSLEWGEYLDRVHRGHHDLALLGWQADSGDPDNFLFVHFDKTSAEPPAGNIAFYRGERVHELLLAGRHAADPEERARVYREAQEILHHDAPWVPLAHTRELAAYRASVHGFRLHPTGRVLLSEVWIAP